MRTYGLSRRTAMDNSSGPNKNADMIFIVVVMVMFGESGDSREGFSYRKMIQVSNLIHTISI